MRELRFSDWVFAGSALAIALGGIFASDYYHGDYILKALIAAMGIVVLWNLFDAVCRSGWKERILDILSDHCDCGSRDYELIILSPLNDLFAWAHYYCPDCKRFFTRVIPLVQGLRGEMS